MKFINELFKNYIIQDTVNYWSDQFSKCNQKTNVWNFDLMVCATSFQFFSKKFEMKYLREAKKFLRNEIERNRKTKWITGSVQSANLKNICKTRAKLSFILSSLNIWDLDEGNFMLVSILHVS